MQLTDWAYRLAEDLLADPLPRRWAHSQGVARCAHVLSPILGSDAELLYAAAMPGVPGPGFQKDGMVRDTEFEGVLAKMHSLTARKTSGRSGAVAAAEHQRFEQPVVTKLRGERGDTQIVAAQPDRNVTASQRLPHLVDFPDEFGPATLFIRDCQPVIRHSLLLRLKASTRELRGPGCRWLGGFGRL